MTQSSLNASLGVREIVYNPNVFNTKTTSLITVIGVIALTVLATGILTLLYSGIGQAPVEASYAFLPFGGAMLAADAIVLVILGIKHQKIVNKMKQYLKYDAESANYIERRQYTAEAALQSLAPKNGNPDVYRDFKLSRKFSTIQEEMKAVFFPSVALLHNGKKSLYIYRYQQDQIGFIRSLQSNAFVRA